ncbi:MAG: Fic family protein [Candidatus Saccharibacteria bacterium]|nr:Fic family protein [Candidatus Saccharibacteria bacterium]
MSKMSVRFYKDREVRAVWDDETNKWWFSAVDVVAAINEEVDNNKSRKYWNTLKSRHEEFQSSTICRQLKMTAIDGKRYLTDSIDQGTISKIARAIGNKKADDFLEWFEYSDKTIDGRSQKKAYELFDSPVYDQIEIGTTKGLQQIHAFIFGGLYDYAGKIRTKNIAKDNFQFAPVQFLDQTLKNIEKMKEETYDEIIDKYVEMNIAHPFMEGNGRSTRIWLDLILKKHLKKCVDWSKIEKQEYLKAMKKSTLNSSDIKSLIKGALTNKINDREIFMKGIDYSYYYEQPE